MKANWRNDIILGTGMLSVAATLLALSFQGQGFIVAGRLAGLPMGAGSLAFVFQWLLPIFTVLFLAAMTLWPNRHRAWLGLSALAVIALATVWTVSLIRHDRLLSVFHSVLLTSSIWLAVWQLGPAKGVHTAVAALAALVVALLSFGVIWGETRCDQRSGVGCLVTAGPRVWVPKLFSTVKLAAFVDLRDTDLRAANLRKRDLRYADFRRADLREVDFSGSNLRRARADKVNAAHSMWRGTFLAGATFSGATLAGSDLRDIQAYRIDLQDADLKGADLRQASLSHGNLSGTRLNGARLEGSYLRFTEGLTQAQLDSACGDQNTQLSPGFTVSNCSEH